MKQRRNKMKTLQKLVMMCTLFVGVLVMLMPQAALAAGTASDTDIINQATVSFDVGGSSTPFNVNVPPSSGGDNDFIALSMGTTMPIRLAQVGFPGA